MDRAALRAAIDYIPRWIEFQLRMNEGPGGTFAVAHRGQVVAEFAFGEADRNLGTRLTPRHRFRVASHSKTFTAAAVLRLREQGRWRLDDPVGRYVGGLHRGVAAATLSQLLSHTAGLVRDGDDAGQWADRRPFLDERELRADLAGGPVLAPSTRLKYSNHGYGLLGLAIESVTGERYGDWVMREIVERSGLEETTPDAPAPAGVPFARGHTARWPLGHRLVIPADQSTRALAAATGFVGTAADLARFFASLAPEARRSVLTVESRREMTRRLWRDPHGSIERWYGLGTVSSAPGGEWEHFGHTGGFQGTITRTVCLPRQQLALSALTHAMDGPSHAWIEAAIHILKAYAQGGAPSRRTAAWRGRWWTSWGALDLLPMAGKVMVANPALANPVMDASEVDPAAGRIVLAGGFASHGEPAELLRGAGGRARELRLGGTRLLPEKRMAAELTRRYAR